MARSMQSIRTAILIALNAVAMSIAASVARSDDASKDAPGGGDGNDGGIAGTPCAFNTASCFVAHPTPGCNNFTCCVAVCQFDPFCCDQQWDNFCVSDANTTCATCGGAGSGYCNSAHPNPACNDAACCSFVCAGDPFCCDTQWDNICANEAITMCLCGGLNTGDCSSTHSNPWCNDAGCCETVCEMDGFCCDVAWDDLCVFYANLNCSCGAGQTGNCFFVHDDPWCHRGACCSEVCISDPFCCDVQWDNFCVGDAFLDCCPADIAPIPQGDGLVNVSDLLAVLNNWGPCPPLTLCTMDISPNGGNGQINSSDLLFVINHWGPCP